MNILAIMGIIKIRKPFTGFIVAIIMSFFLYIYFKNTVIMSVGRTIGFLFYFFSTLHESTLHESNRSDECSRILVLYILCYNTGVFPPIGIETILPAYVTETRALEGCHANSFQGDRVGGLKLSSCFDIPTVACTYIPHMSVPYRDTVIR